MLSDQRDKDEEKKTAKAKQPERKTRTSDERLFTGVVLNNTTVFVLRTLFDDRNRFAAKTSSLMCQ